MPDYSKGKIYKIVDNTNDNIYIGSTTQDLKSRLKTHKAQYKLSLKNNKVKNTSFQIIKNNNYKIELIVDYPCNNKRELELREAEHIRNNKCINKQIPGRTRKEYRESNKEKIKEIKKKNYQNNKEIILQKQKIYKLKNKEYYKNLNIYYKSMGGSKYKNNMSLLKIDINLFQ